MGASEMVRLFSVEGHSGYDPGKGWSREGEVTGAYLEGPGTANAQRAEAKIMGKGHLMVSLKAVTDR